MSDRKGGFLILASEPSLRVEEQDWSRLVLEAHMASREGTVGAAGRTATARTLFERGTGARTEISMLTDAARRTVSFAIGRAEDGASRAWVVRLHVPPGAAVASATVDGTEASSFATLEPIAGTDSAAHRPFGGAGAPPAAGAGRVAEVHLRASRLARSVELAITY